ncbi:asparagine synthase-related protein [Streptomyces sp. ME19-01-6]|uniref:asparagine synthase-related protein n=1 Tax=Streptomyces sp. ME19-01-6 TaxID=3028686 RepID=UPI0029B50A35|nr:asparagine synthase-related protein [Streptomyces sp. ME19-01-6]MDX3232549.1 asparagine synthase-related protein [Streptomyces sp. ME19-01-6]
MARFVAGKCPTSTTGSALEVRPRDAREVWAAGRAWLWAVGHDERDIATTVDKSTGARLFTVGGCLATRAERHAALTAALGGDLRPALYLPGSQLAVVHSDGTLRVVGDRAGVVPVYWLPYENSIWWSTAAAPLAALAGAGPNLRLLLAELTLTGVDVRLHEAHYEKVRRVPPGHALILRYGRELSTAPVGEAKPSGLVDGVRRLRCAFTPAVERRAKAYERLTADLSGGVDSSSVTCIAARTRPLLAVTYTDAQMAEDDDARYARRAAAEVDGITHQVVDARAAGVAHFDALADADALPTTDIPSLTLGLLAIKDAQLTPATASGSQAHLTGRGGDNVLSAAHSHLVDAFLAGRRASALRRAAAYARSQRVTPWRVWQQLATTAATPYPRALERLATRLTGPGPLAATSPGASSLAWCSVTAAGDWLTTDGRRAVGELVADRAGVADPYITPAVLHDRLGLEWMASSHAMFDAIARQRWNLPIHAPFLDSAVIDASMSIPAYERVRHGVYKPLAQVAFTGLVPHFLLHRTTKTAFTTSLYAGLAANAPVLRRIIDHSELAQAGLLDAGQAAASLHAAVAGAPAPLAALHTLLVTELWLARLQTARATWWQPDLQRSSPCR